jgi:hypothetical protein
MEAGHNWQGETQTSMLPINYNFGSFRKKNRQSKCTVCGCRFGKRR